MKAVFLVECGSRYGLGHLRRSQVLAKVMMSRGWECCLGISDTDMVHMVENEKFITAPWINDGLDLGPSDALIVDGYNYDPELFCRWRNYTQVSLALDDLAERPVPANVILNHNLYGAELDYSEYESDLNIGGADYSLVDQKFFDVGSIVRKSPEHILVSFGGTDDGMYSAPVAQAILDRDLNVVVEIVVSILKVPSQELLNLKVDHASRVIIHHGANMADVMSRCKVLTGSGGLTVQEALAARLKLVVCATSENQLINISTLKKLGVSSFDSINPKEMAKSALALMNEAQNGAVILDAKGPERVIDVLSKVICENLKRSN